MKALAVNKSKSSFDREKKIKKVKTESRKPKYKHQLFATEY